MKPGSLSQEEAEEMGLKEVLFRKSDLKIAAAAHEEARLAVVRFEARTEKVTTWLEADGAEKGAAVTAFKLAEEEVVAALAQGDELPDIETDIEIHHQRVETHRQKVDSAERKVRTIEVAIEKRNRELKTLIDRRTEAFKALCDEDLKAEAEKFSTMLIEISEQ